MACGGYHTLVLTKENMLFGFGSNVSGECGFSEAKNLNLPKKITVMGTRQPFDSFARMMQEEKGANEPQEVTIKTIVAGGKHSMVLTVDGSLYTFGYG